MTATIATTGTKRPAVRHHLSRRLAIDPYRIDEIAFTREEILRARADVRRTARRAHR
jgi:hypothetical protein